MVQNRIGGQMKYNSLELFVGAGGLALGVERAGFNHIAVFENDAAACKTLEANRIKWFKSLSEENIIMDDVRNIDFKMYKNIDLLVGGPPCQPFSLGGKHKGSYDKRDMFPEMIRALREIKPKILLIENVKGFNRESFSGYRNYILSQIENPFLLQKKDETIEEHYDRLLKDNTTPYYKIKTKLLNAANFGVPQKRERFFIVAIRSDLDISWDFPEETHSLTSLEWAKYIDESYWTRHGLEKPLLLSKAVQKRIKKLAFPFEAPWVTIRDALNDLSNPELNEIPELNHYFITGAKIYPGHTGSPLDFPSKTIKAGDHGVPGGENMLIKDTGEPRYFSVREAARIQTFPDDYIFPHLWGKSMKQIGNAVPVKLAEEIAGSLKKSLDKIEKKVI